MASFIFFVKEIAPYAFLFVVYELDQICHIFTREAISLINSFLANSVWANYVLLVGFILLLIDMRVIRAVNVKADSWLHAGIYDRSRWFLGVLLIIYIFWSLLMIFMNRLADANLFSCFLFLWSHVMSAWLLNSLGNLNMKRFWIYVSVIKFITFIIVVMLNVFTSFESVYPLIGWSPQLLDFYTLNVMTLWEWSPGKWFLFLIPCSQLVLPWQGAYYAVGLGLSFSSSKIGSFGIELDRLIKDQFLGHYQFQSAMLFLEHISVNKKVTHWNIFYN